MCRRPWVAVPAAVTPCSVGKYRRWGRDPREPRWWATESTRPRSANLSRRSRSVDAGRRQQRASSSTVVRGVAHSSSSSSAFSRPRRRGRRAGSGRRLQVDDDLRGGGLDLLDAAADGFQDGGRRGASGMAPFQVAPEGVAGHAQRFGGLLLSVTPLVGVYVVAGGIVEILPVFLRCVFGRCRRCRLLFRQGDSSCCSGLTFHPLSKPKPR